MKTNKGFTLTELVVVIILVLIVVIVLTKIKPLKPNHRKIQCIGQLKSIGTGIALYQNDYNDWNPVVWGNKGQKGVFGIGIYNKLGETENTWWIDPSFNDWGDNPTVGGCLYLLIKHEGLSLANFVCPDSKDSWLDSDFAIIMCKINGWELPSNFDYDDLNDFASMANLS